MTRIRGCVAILLLILVLPAAVAGCGGDGGGGGEDPSEVLDQTFNNPEGITSGQVSISLVSGTLTATIEGPFQTDKDNPAAFPQLDLSVQINASGASQPVDFDGGLVATKDNAFVEYQGQAYEVGSAYFQRFQRVYQRLGRQAQARRRNSSASSIFERLGIDPQTWLTNLSNEGEETVEGTETIHVHGDADVEQIVSDVGRIAQRAPGGAAQAVDPAQLERVESAIQDASLDVYSGKDDRILRKLSLSLDIVPPEGAGGSAGSDVTVDFSLTLRDVNGAQAISGPSSAEPISGLLNGLGLGGLGLPGSPDGSSGSGGGGTSSDYLTCIEDATTPAEINECASEL